MSPGMVDAIAAVSLTFVIGLIILLFPLSRRLGRVLEEWIKLRQESSPDRDRLEGLELGQREIRQLVEALDQRTQLLADRQDFMESLIEQKKPDVLPQPQGGKQF
ncbi:MAG: hypothetical protein P8Y10_09535 [Gemmatimonadales bacterium]|jgi:Na+/phosphate symporter